MKKQFKKYGDNFVQLIEDSGWYIYKRTPYKFDLTGDEKRGGMEFPSVRSHYEIVKPIKANLAVNKETGIRPSGYIFIYPNSNKWGEYGFTARSEERAFEIFMREVEKENGKN